MRDCFPKNIIITFLNDNSWSSSLRFAEKSYRRALQKTINNSSVILCISKYILNQINEKKRKRLFWPWAQEQYQKPKKKVRNTILYFGFLNRRLDLCVIKKLAEEIHQQKRKNKILLVGPFEQNIKDILILKKFKSILIKKTVKNPSKIKWDKVLCGLIPYKGRIPENDAIELPNKAMKFFVRGIPLLISGMPNFLQKPFVYRIPFKSEESFLDILDQIKDEFMRNQPLIQRFVQENSQAQRLKTLFGEIKILLAENNNLNKEKKIP